MYVHIYALSIIAYPYIHAHTPVQACIYTYSFMYTEFKRTETSIATFVRKIREANY